MNLDEELARRIAEQQRAAEVASSRRAQDEERRRSAEAERDVVWEELQELTKQCAARLSSAGVKPARIVYEERVSGGLFGQTRLEHRGDYGWGWRYGSYWGRNYAICSHTDGRFFVAEFRDLDLLWTHGSGEAPKTAAERSGSVESNMIEMRNGRIVARHHDSREVEMYADVVEALLDGVADALRRASRVRYNF